MSQDEVEELRLAMQEAERRALEARKQQMEELSREQALEELSAAIQELGAKARTAEALEAKVLAAEEKVVSQRKLGRRLALAVGSLLLGLAHVSALGEPAVTEFLGAPEPLPRDQRRLLDKSGL